jgi:uncharacterized protein YqjF (DUF2071 family)
MHMRWDTITFLHWRYDPAEVQRLLPPGLSVETYEGAAWVGLVPFVMSVWWPGVPPAPWLSHFPETNVRTYARDAGGRSGVWFFSLDASRLPAVLAARSGWGLPYFWSRMRVLAGADRVRYVSDRRWPTPPARLRLVVRPGDPLDEPGVLDHFLTARFALWSHFVGRLWRSEAAHPRWPLRGGAVEACDDTLMTAAGLRAPSAEPLVHYSAGVQVRVGPPRPA